MRSTLLLTLLAAATSQDWGTSGSWSQVIPVPLTPGGAINAPTIAYPHAQVIPGSFVVLGNNSLTGLSDLYLYNVATNQWSSPFPDVPSGVPMNQPFILPYAGTAVVIDESNPNSLFFVDTSLSSGLWTAASSSGAPNNRIAQRFLPWGSTVYSFGGFDTVAIAQNNDMYALDLTSIIAVQPSPWIEVSPAAINGVVPNYPPARVGYTFTPFTIGAIMIGGLSLNNIADGTPAAGDPFQCVFGSTAPPAGTQCFWHSHVWAFLPGMGSPKTPGGQTAASWVRLAQAGANGGPTPEGRFEHCAGNMGDQVFVYGGMTPAPFGGVGLVASTELWAYNLPSQTWALISIQGGAAPTAQAWIAGTVVGHSLYVFLSQWPAGGPGGGGGGPPTPAALWKWTPSQGGPVAISSNSGGTSLAIANGHTAGIVIGLLIGFFNVYILVLLATKEDIQILPSFLSFLSCGSCLGGGGKTSAPVGFYTSTASSANDGYAPPPA